EGPRRNGRQLRVRCHDRGIAEGGRDRDPRVRQLHGTPLQALRRSQPPHGQPRPRPREASPFLQGGQGVEGAGGQQPSPLTATVLGRDGEPLQREHRHGRRRLTRLALFVALLTPLACRATPPAVVDEPAERAAPALHEGPLTEYVPAPTLRWLLLAHPERIAAAPGVLEALAPLVSDDGWSRFTERNGFDPRRSPTLLAAGFELGTLYLIEPPEPAHGRSMEERFRERLSHGEVVARPHPALTPVQGVLAGTPQALLRVEDRFVAHADGDPSLIRIVEGFLLGRFTKTPSALRGATLRAHATFADGAPLRAWIPGPLDDLSVFPDSE